MRNKTKPSKLKNRKLSKSEKKKLEALAIRAVKEAFGQEITPGTLSTNIKNCPDCGHPMRRESGRDVCSCGYSLCE